MDDQTLVFKEMRFRGHRVAQDRRHFRQDRQSLVQRVGNRDIVSQRILSIQHQQGLLDLVHHIHAWITQDVGRQKAFRQRVAPAQFSGKQIQLRTAWQMAEQNQKARFLITADLILIEIPAQLGDRNPPVVQLTAIVHLFPVDQLVADDVRDPGQTDQDAGAVFIAKAFLYVIFCV